MYRKNIANQSVWAQMNSATTGAGLTTGVSVNVTSPGNYGAGAGTLTHRGGGFWEYVFTQAETNFNQFGYQFTHASGVAVGGAIAPTAADPTDTVRFGLTALPNATAGSNGGVPTVDTNNAVKVQSGTGANQISLSSGLVALQADQAVNVTKVNATAQTARDLGAQLDAAITTRAASSTALSNAVWTDTKAGYVDAAISTRSTLDAAGVWAAGTRTLSSFGTLVSDIWNALISGMTTAGSIGKKLADWILGSDNKAVLSADTHTSGVTVANMADKTGMAVATGGIASTAFAAGAVDAAALATDAAQEVADALLDRANAIETGVTLRAALRGAISVLFGKLSGAGTATEVFRNAVGDSKDRVTASVDASGNRTSISTDLS